MKARMMERKAVIYQNWCCLLYTSLGHSEVMTGLLLTPWPLATLVTAPLAGYLVERIHPGILGSIGMVLFAIGLFSLSSLTAESSDISIILRLKMCIRDRFPVLHFYDNTFTGIGYAIDVVDKTSFCFYFRLLFTCLLYTSRCV